MKFYHEKLPDSFLSRIDDVQNISLITRVALDMGAYIAGGFAYRLLSLYSRGWKPYWRPIKLGSSEQQIREAKIQAEIEHKVFRYLYEEIGGDIDVFFTNKAAFDEFNTKLQKSDLAKLCETKRDGKLLDYRIENTSVPSGWLQRPNLQVILTAHDIDVMLPSFDIKNAMVGFTKNQLISAEGWYELELRKELHVENWRPMPDTIGTIRRIFKWFSKHSFRKLTPATASKLGSVTFDALDWAEKNKTDSNLGEISKIVCTDGNEFAITLNQLLGFVRQYLPALTSEQLVLLSTVMPHNSTGYTFVENPMRVLQERFNESMIPQKSFTLSADALLPQVAVNSASDI